MELIAATPNGGRRSDGRRSVAHNEQRPSHTYHRAERGGGCRYREAYHQTGTGRARKARDTT
uniref:Uncharacterized protein n=1 Tax=viral metagenome TaxID=1070528 RepID=A0A6M3XBZ2_9ZZZZ